MSGSQQLLLGGIPTAVPVDPYFYSVTSLLHGDGVNGGQNNTFLDSSTNNFTITRNGNTTQGSFSPFSQTGWSNYFDGTGDYLRVADNAAFTLGSGDFTIECWVYPTAVGSIYRSFSGQSDSAGTVTSRSFRTAINTSSQFEGVVSSGTTNYTATSTGLAVANAWQHYAFVRDGNTGRLYINGVQDGTVNLTGVTVNNSSNQLGIGIQGEGTTNGLTGYLSNYRMVVGTCLYPNGTTFTPSTTPLTAISGTSLLTCQANRFLDASSNNFTITRNGDVSVQPFSPFNPTTAYSTSAIGGSGYFDGSGDFLNFTASSVSTSADFTVECWIYPNASIPSNHGIFALSDARFGLITVSGNLFLLTTTGDINTSTALRVYEWSHIAVTRTSNVLRVFLNGVQVGATQSNSQSLSGNWRIASNQSGEIFPACYITGARILIGTGGTSVPVPTAPLTAITNTNFLCNFTNGAIFDNAAVADYETVGNAQISTSVKKYGTGSIAFDGSGDRLVGAPIQTRAPGTGDFCYEFWLYANATTSSCLFDTRAVNNNTTGFACLLNGSSQIALYTSTTILTCGLALSASTWYHIAVTRTAGVIKVFVNGTVVGTLANTSNFSDRTLQLGQYIDSTGSLNGYIDDFRSSNGVGRYAYNFTPPTAEFPNIGGTVTLTADPYYDYTTLLLPGNGTNGAQNNTFLDGSTNNFTITRNGNTTQGTFSPFSQTGWSNYFDGSGDYLETPSNAAFTLGSSGDFTVECWVYATATPGNYAAFMTTWADANTGYPNRWFIGVHDSKIKWYNDAGASAIAASSNIQLNTWLHVAAVRSGSTITLYINGTAIGTQTTSQSYTTQGTVKLGYSGTGGNYFYGYISNARVVKGTAVYTANFTPPTAPLTAITNTSLLTCQSNRFIDNSTNAFAITRNGDVSVQAFSPFNPTASWSAATNGGSGYFDGSGDYLTTNATQAIPATGDFTIEAWVYPTVSGSGRNIVSQGTTGTSGRLQLNVHTDNTLQFAITSTIVYSTGTVQPFAWNYVAVTRTGSSVAFYINGASAGTATLSGTVQNTTLSVGSEWSGDPYRWLGYLTSVRISNTLRTISSSPTAPLTSDGNTVFLCNFTNAGIFDATSKNDLETVGNAQISTTQSKFGGSSMYFDGSGDRLTIPFTNDFLELGINGQNFTVEAWIYPTNTMASAGQMLSKGGGTASWSTSNGAQYQWGIQNSAAYWSWNSSGSALQITNGNVTLNAWQHLAVTYDGTTTRTFLNGVLQATSTSPYTAPTTRNVQYIGMTQSGGFTQEYYGYIQDLRITKGIARYFSNFTPPTTAFLTL